MPRLLQEGFHKPKSSSLRPSWHKMAPEITSLERFRSHFEKLNKLISANVFQKHQLLHIMALKKKSVFPVSFTIQMWNKINKR